MEVLGVLGQHCGMGNDICSASSSISCAVLGDICISEALKQPGDLALPNVKCNEESISAGTFQSASVGFSDMPVNSKVDLISADAKFEKPVRNKKTNRNKSYSSKKVNDLIVSTTVERKYEGSNGKPFSSSIKEDILSPAMNWGNDLENYSPMVNSTSLCEIQVKRCSEDPIIHNCKTSIDPLGNKQGCEVCSSSHTTRERNSFKCHNLASELDAVNKTGNHQHILRGKENSHSNWQRRQKVLRERQTSYYLQKDASMFQMNLFSKQNSGFGKGLLPTPLFDSSRDTGAANGITTKKNMRIRQKVLVESSKRVSQGRLNRRIDHHVSQSSQVAPCESDYNQEQEWKSNRSFKPLNCCRSRKGSGSRGKNVLRSHDNLCLYRKESLEVPFEMNNHKNHYMAQRNYGDQHAFSAHRQPTRTCSKKFTLPVQCGFQPYTGMRIPRMNNVSARSFHASANSESYMTFKESNDHRFHEDLTFGMNATKWVPVGNKGSSISEKTGCNGICHDGDLPFSRGEHDGPMGRNLIDYHASAISSRVIAGHYLNIVRTEASKPDIHSTSTEVHHVKNAKVRSKCAKFFEDVPHLIAGLRLAADPLNAAYKLQLVSEGFELVSGCPLTELERFLLCAAPVIASSYQHSSCSVCSYDQLSTSSVCKHQMPNTSLFSVWNWYEEPGNFGLKVKTGDIQNLKGLLTESTSSHAHFVPYLSAVRLFGYSRLSNSCGTNKGCSNADAHIRNSSTALTAINSLASVEEHVNSYKDFSSGRHSQSFIPSPACSSDCELVFEFFESEKPWLRKPLHTKILDLFDVEAHNLQVSGDPSKLKSLKLNDLHPASWFSVAWYPIYRIPEGKFSAAFLTYHSLGHLVMRDVSNNTLKKKTPSVISPVVGLLSYKAQAENWFDLKIPKSHFQEASVFNMSEILLEQLKVLEENAAHYSGGCVQTDGINMFNRHQDYEFFSSRK